MIDYNTMVWYVYAFMIVALGILTFFLWRHRDEFVQTMQQINSKQRLGESLPTITSSHKQMIEHNVVEEKTFSVSADTIEEAHKIYLKVRGNKNGK